MLIREKDLAKQDFFTKA